MFVNFLSAFTLTAQPDPPLIGKVTHCSVELLWDQDREPDPPDKPRIKYFLQQQMGKNEEYTVIYW